jgi:hypothetical protein
MGCGASGWAPISSTCDEMAFLGEMLGMVDSKFNSRLKYNLLDGTKRNKLLNCKK